MCSRQGPRRPRFVAWGIAESGMIWDAKKLSPTQRNWPVYEQEMYMIIHALKTWQHYLYGAQFK